MAVNHTSFGQVIRRHFNSNAIASEYADTVFAHAPRGMSNDYMIIFKFDAKCSIGK